MPSNISLGDGLWTSASGNFKDRKPRRSKGVPLKERLSQVSQGSEGDDFSSNFSGSSTGSLEKSNKSPSPGPSLTGSLPSPGVTSPKKTADPWGSLPADGIRVNGATSAEPNAATTPTTPTTPPVTANTKRGLFGRLKKNSTATGPGSSFDVFHFEGEGLTFRGKLIGIRDVEGPRGDEMCAAAMGELVRALRQSKEHKPRIQIGVALSGLRIKDEKGTMVMHQHPIPKISYIWRDQADPRSFGYIYGLPDSGHRFFAVKADKSADSLVGAIHRLFQLAFTMKQHELDAARKAQGQEGAKGEDKTDAAGEQSTVSAVSHPEEGNLLDLESELQFLSQGLEQMSTMPMSAPGEWIADFGGQESNQSAFMSSASSSSSASAASDPWGAGGQGSPGRGGPSPQSLRTMTPDPFDTVVATAASLGSASMMAPPPQVPARPMTLPMQTAQTSGPWSGMNGSVFGPPMTSNASAAYSLPGAFAMENPFGLPSTPHPSPAHSDFAVFSDPFAASSTTSVFDPPVVQQASPPETRMSSSVDVFSTGELFNDLFKFGQPREKKMSREHFPQPIKPKLGELRGESTMLQPSPVTVDPFLINASLTSPNNSFDPFTSSSAPMRKVSDTSMPMSFSPPVLPPRPNNAGFAQEPNPFIISAPPAAPLRRPGIVAGPVVSALGLSLQQQQTPLMTKVNDPFNDNFFG